MTPPLRIRTTGQLRRALVVALLLSSSVWAGGELPGRSSIEAGTRAGRASCQTAMHDSAFPFTSCLDDLLRAAPDRTRADRSYRLGLAYYGWVAAASATRNGLRGSEDAAIHFMSVFRPLQKALHVTDDALCTTIEGDCVVRNARLAQMESEHPAPTPKAPPAPRRPRR